MPSEPETKEQSWGERAASPMFVLGTAAVFALFLVAVLGTPKDRTAPQVATATTQGATESAYKKIDSCPSGFAEAAQTYIRAWGYSCDEVSACTPFVLSRGARINCSLRYTYYVEDKGGNWVVQIQ